MSWQPLYLSFKLAFFTTIILLVTALPFAYWLAYTKNKLKPVIETLVALPLVLPSTVLGFYLLLAWSPANFFGHWLHQTFGLQLVFSFEGMVIASVIYSLPFMVQPIENGFQQLNPRLSEASTLAGKSKTTTFFRVLLPNIRSAIITAIVLTFAHTLGEFGIILMIGGGIEGETKVASVAIYNEVEALNYPNAHLYALVLVGLSFAVLLWVQLVNRKKQLLA